MSDAITLNVLSSSPVQLDVGDADPIAREEIAALATRVTTVEGDVTALDGRMDAAEGDISTLGTTVDGIDARVEAIEADYVTSEDVMGALGGEAPTLVSGSSRAMLGDPETASWMERTTAADGAALIESVRGNTLRWNQLLRTNNGTSTIAQGVTRVINNGVVTLNGTSPAAESVKHVNLAGTIMTFTNGHKYLINIHNERLNYYANVTGSYSGYTYPRIFTAGADQLNGQLILTIPAAETVFENEVYTPQVFDLTAMFGAGNEPSTVAEFEALYPKPYYPYDPGSLLPVRMEGVETVAADESWSSQRTIPAATYFPDGMRSAGSVRDELTETQAITRVGSVDLGTLTWVKGSALNDGTGTIFRALFTTGFMSGQVNVACASFNPVVYTSPYENITKGDIFITGNFVVVGGDSSLTANTFKESVSGVAMFYQLTTPTTTPIDPPLPLSYLVGAGGTERVMVASGTTSAPPVFATRYPLDPADLAASIAPVDGPTAKTNHQVGDLLMLGFTLCKATQVIVTGETIAIGTNVTKTTVAAELAALSE